MRPAFIGRTVVLVSVPFVSTRGRPAEVQDTNSFGQRNLSDYWKITTGLRNISADVPPMMPEREARLNAAPAAP